MFSCCFSKGILIYNPEERQRQLFLESLFSLSSAECWQFRGARGLPVQPCHRESAKGTRNRSQKLPPARVVLFSHFILATVKALHFNVFLHRQSCSSHYCRSSNYLNIYTIGNIRITYTCISSYPGLLYIQVFH